MADTTGQSAPISAREAHTQRESEALVGWDAARQRARTLTTKAAGAKNKRDTLARLEDTSVEQAYRGFDVLTEQVQQTIDRESMAWASRLARVPAMPDMPPPELVDALMFSKLATELRECITNAAAKGSMSLHDKPIAEIRAEVAALHEKYVALEREAESARDEASGMANKLTRIQRGNG